MQTGTEQFQDCVSMGINLMASANYAEAVKAFEKALEMSPEDCDACLHLGNAHANLRNGKQAVAAFQKALLLRPDSGEILFSIGSVHFMSDDYVNAIRFYNKAEAAGYESADMYQIMATMYIQVGEGLQALRTINRAIKLSPFDGALRAQKASLQIGGGKMEEALETLEAFEELMPDAFEAYDMRAKILLAQGKHEESLQVADRAVERFPEDGRVRLIRLNALVESGKLDEAEREAALMREKGLAAALDHDFALLEAQLYSARQDGAKLVAVLDDALARQPKAGDLWYLKLNAHISLDQYAKTIETADRMTSIEMPLSFLAAAKFNRALAMKRLNREEGARSAFRVLAKEFQKMTIKDSSLYEVYLYRLLCHNEIGEYDRALELADYIEHMNPERGDANLFRSIVYRTMGDEEKARAEEAAARAKKQAP